MNIGICDDEKLILDIIYSKTVSLLKNIGKNANIYTFTNGKELIKEYDATESPFDIIFLDIKMDKLDGIETAKLIRSKDANALIVFITCSAEYVFKGYEVKAFRYLMKNEIEYGFSKVFKDCISEIENTEKKCFSFKFGTDTEALPLDKILYFESIKRVIHIVTAETKYKTYAKMDDIEKTVCDENFIRCHQSFYVNAKKIKKLKKSEIVLINDEVIPVSKKHRQNVNDAYLWAMR